MKKNLATLIATPEIISQNDHRKVDQILNEDHHTSIRGDYDYQDSDSYEQPIRDSQQGYAPIDTDQSYTKAGPHPAEAQEDKGAHVKS